MRVIKLAKDSLFRIIQTDRISRFCRLVQRGVRQFRILLHKLTPCRVVPHRSDADYVDQPLRCDNFLDYSPSRSDIEPLLHLQDEPDSRDSRVIFLDRCLFSLVEVSTCRFIKINIFEYQIFKIPL